MPDRLDPTFLRMQIEALKLAYPEIWEEDEVLLGDMLEAETSLHDYLTLVVRTMREATAFADGMKKVIADQQARQARYQRRGEAMRSLAFKLMIAADVRKVELAQATLSIRLGAPHVIVTDERALPDNFVRIKREPDKIKIKESLTNGDRVPGAEMSNAEPVLNVRTR